MYYYTKRLKLIELRLIRPILKRISAYISTPDIPIIMILHRVLETVNY